MALSPSSNVYWIIRLFLRPTRDRWTAFAARLVRAQTRANSRPPKVEQVLARLRRIGIGGPISISAALCQIRLRKLERRSANGRPTGIRKEKLFSDSFRDEGAPYQCEDRASSFPSLCESQRCREIGSAAFSDFHFCSIAASCRRRRPDNELMATSSSLSEPILRGGRRRQSLKCRLQRRLSNLKALGFVEVDRGSEGGELEAPQLAHIVIR